MAPIKMCVIGLTVFVIRFVLTEVCDRNVASDCQLQV